jgi:hypothetical protein
LRAKRRSAGCNFLDGTEFDLQADATPENTDKTFAVFENFGRFQKDIAPLPLQPMIQPTFSLGMGFALQLHGPQAFQFPRRVPLFHFPALPDGSKAGGDFFVVQPFRRAAQAVG